MEYQCPKCGASFADEGYKYRHAGSKVCRKNTEKYQALLEYRKQFAATRDHLTDAGKMAERAGEGGADATR